MFSWCSGMTLLLSDIELLLKDLFIMFISLNLLLLLLALPVNSETGNDTADRFLSFISSMLI